MSISEKLEMQFVKLRSNPPGNTKWLAELTGGTTGC